MRAPPIVGLALAHAVGTAWGLSGAWMWTAPLGVLAWWAAPVRPSARPRRWALIAAGVVGAGAARVAERAPGCDPPEPGTRAVLHGRFVAGPRAGSAPFDVGRCGTWTVVTSDSLLPAGVPLVVEGTWVEGRRRPWMRAAGRPGPAASGPGGASAGDGGAARPYRTGPTAGSAEGLLTRIRWAPVRWRDALARRIAALYGERGPLVSALTLARREGMDRELGDRFARTGIAHLLAISGFHVGVIAGAAVALLRLAGVGRRRAGVGAAGLAWAYVALIGFPDAASRAALILTLVAAARIRGRPPARWGALATALLALLVLDPTHLSSPGFQLSFLGAGGLAAWSRPWTLAIEARCRGRCPRALASALGAGAAATVSTLPAVAWHFERVSLIGIPVTLLATPLVSVALPGAILSVTVDFGWHGAGRFLAGGVDVLLAALEALTVRAAEPEWISAWVTRPSVVAALTGVTGAMMLARRPWVGARGRRALVGAYAAGAVIAWPLLVAVGARGAVELVVIDVGQGDAIAIRSPRGRWALVDAGPPERGGRGDEAHPVVRALRARGVRRLELLVLTHADLDHIGGAGPVLRSFDVGVVVDPALPAGKGEYANVLTAAIERSVPWSAARAGDVHELDGLSLTVLSPPDPLPDDVETNEASVVIHLRLGAFDALLTGDAYKDTERRLVASLASIEVLKVGHHGSDTSTDSLLLARTAPEIALVSLGRFNRYGHPSPAVLRRLGGAGVEVLRTDQVGTITVRGRPDGTFSVRTGR